MKKKNLLRISLVLLLFLFPLHAKAAQDADVVITNMSYEEEFSEKFESKVKICFLNQELYNDNVFLSYHIFDTVGNDLLQYENQRIKIRLDDKGEMECTVAIDLKDILKDSDAVIVRYDIVDQSNLYWFAANSEIDFSTIDIKCRIDQSSANLRILKNGVTSHPIIFAINLIVAIATIVVVLYVKYTYYNSMNK